MAAQQTRKPMATIVKLSVLAVAMFAFAVFVMPPLYSLFCDITGLNGKTGDRYTNTVTAVDKDRIVKVQFLATNNRGMTWEFEPTEYEVRVHPGEATSITYFARNTTERDMVAQAIPSVSPGNATAYFHKTECFCFNQQPLAAGKSAELGLQFIVDRDLPPEVDTITLSYTLFDVTDRVKKAKEPEPQVSATQTFPTTAIQ